MYSAYFSNLVNNAVRNPSQTKDTIRIYCNANHLEKKANSEDTLDKDNFADLVKEALTACDIEIPNPTDANGPKGFVIAWTGVVDDVPDDQKFSTVVICPKTIQKFQAMAKGAANIPVTLPPWTKDPNLLKDAGFLATANKISVMDMLALLDVIMLHEVRRSSPFTRYFMNVNMALLYGTNPRKFTHTLIAAANQEEGRSEDIGGNSLAGNTDSYGWTNVLRLARDDPDRCDFNAGMNYPLSKAKPDSEKLISSTDSLAYFALGVAIVNVGGIPNDDGSITVSNPPPTQALAALQVGVVNNAASSGGSGGQNQSQAGNHSAIAARHLFGYKQRAWIG